MPPQPSELRALGLEAYLFHLIDIDCKSAKAQSYKPLRSVSKSLVAKVITSSPELRTDRQQLALNLILGAMTKMSTRYLSEP